MFSNSAVSGVGATTETETVGVSASTACTQYAGSHSSSPGCKSTVTARTALEKDSDGAS